MADIYSHSKLAKEVVVNLEKKVDYDNLYLGAQGPDPLYYNFFSKSSTYYRTLADTMHDTKTRKLLTEMVNYLKKHPSKALYSYLIGFISHYALDVHIHPYVYNKVGVYDKDDESTHSYRGLHLKFERAIDCVVLEIDTEEKAHKFNFINDIFRTSKVSPEVVKMYDSVLDKVYEYPDGGTMFSIATKAMYNNVKYLVRDRFGIKTQLYKVVDFFKKDIDLFMRDLTLYDRIEKYDYLNKEKSTWYHPVTNEESNKSVAEIKYDALEFAITMVDQVDLYLKGDKSVKLSNVFTNLSFNTGLNCDRKTAMKYFNIYNEEVS